MGFKLIAGLKALTKKYIILENKHSLYKMFYSLIGG